MNISQVNYPGLQRLGQLKMSQTTYNPKSGTIKRQAHPDVMIIDYDNTIKQDIAMFPNARQIRKDPRGRIYILTIDGKIIKIGGSQTKGGIDGTIGAYLGGGKKGKKGAGKGNSKRTYAIWKVLIDAVKAGKQVEIYFKLLPSLEKEIQGLDGTPELLIIYDDYHQYENQLVQNFKKITGHFPKLNTQESSTKWEDIVDISEHAGM